MARIINFYIPASFRRKTSKPLPPEERGKLIRFTPMAKKKSAWEIWRGRSQANGA